MNIRKQLDDLKKQGATPLEYLEDALEMYEKGMYKAEFIVETVLPKLLIKLGGKPDPKGDISNIGRDKLDEWSRRNQKIDTEEPEEEKGLVSSAARAIGGDELV